MSDKLKKVLIETHPQYDARKPNWDFFLQSYEGGSHYFTKENIFTHGRELASDYEERLKRAHYQNYTEAVISIYTGHLFKKPIVRDTNGDEDFEQFFTNVDRNEDGIDNFMKDVADLAQVHGNVYILVDKPYTNGEIITKADEQANNITPYYTVVYPQNLINWELDNDGNLIWARLQEIQQKQENPFESRETETLYRTYTRDEWYIHDDKGNQISTGTHNLGEVPIVPVYNKKLKRYPFFGWSAIEDIAYIYRAIANIASLMDEYIYRQCFNILVWPSSGVPQLEEAEGEVELSTDNLMAIADDVGFQPDYLTPPTEPAEFLLSYGQELRDIIYMLAKTEAPDFSPKEESGLSKQYDFHETNQSLADKADNLENAEIKCHKIRARWMDKEWDGIIDYPEDFDIRQINAELEEALKVKMYGFPASFQKEYDRSLYRKLLPKLQKELIAKIDEDIDRGVGTLNQVTEEEEAVVRRVTERLRGRENEPV